MTSPTGQLPRVAAGGRWRLLAALVANGFGQAGATIGTALLVERAFSQLLVPSTPPRPGQVATLGAGLLAAAGVAGWLRARERTDAERLGQRYVHGLRLRLFERLTASSSRVLQQRSQGATVLRFIGDLTALRKWVSLGLARLLVAGTMTAGALCALALLSPALGLLVGAVLVLSAGASYVLGTGMRRASREARRRRARLAANVNEKVGAVAVVQAFGQADRERARVRKQSRRLQQAMIERARYAGRLRGLTEGAAGAATAVVVIAGISGQVPPGTVAAAMTVVGLLVAPLRDLGRIQEYWHNAVIAREKLRDVLARPTGLAEPAPAAAPALRPGPGRLVLDGVAVDGILEGISATAEPGHVVAVVGPNGAGKTTLLSALARLIELDAGRVLLDGQDLAAHHATEVRRCLGLVGPDLPLLRGTVERNLRYRWPDAPPEELHRVMALCGVPEALEALPDGLQTRIAEGGAGLSAGQRQRLALARALVGDPAVLLLDEADANLDHEAIAVVDRVLAGHRGTVLVVTHHVERVAGADVVWHLRGGRLVERGPPAELLAGDGHTARMFAPHVEPAR